MDNHAFTVKGYLNILKVITSLLLQRKTFPFQLISAKSFTSPPEIHTFKACTHTLVLSLLPWKETQNHKVIV
jgi:hypothetical protein